VWQVKDGRIEVGLADDCDGCAGVIGKVEMRADVAVPRIRQGVLMLPVGGGAGGALAGMITTAGERVTWGQMEAKAVDLAVLFLDGYRLYLTGQVKNGFLQIDTKAV
jgi:hypothetical protein